MTGAVKLSLYIGAGVPLEAPHEVVEALASATVMSGAGDSQSGFELTFDLPPRSPLRTLFLLTGGGNLPLMRVALVVTINGQAQSIIDGMTTDVEMKPGEGGVGQLVVKGKDMSALMDMIDFTGLPYPAMPPAARVLIIVAKYAAVGVIPLVIPSVVEDIPIPVQRYPVQKGSDYKYVKKLAEQCGYVFYLEPGPEPGMSKAYWGPEVRVGAPQPALSMNMDALTNVEEMSFNFDREKKIMPIVYFQESVSKVPIGVPIPDISPLTPPLGMVPPLPTEIRSLSDTAHMSAISALMTGLAFAGQNGDSVFGKGRLDVARYGRLLKSRSLVGVRGAGLPFDGLYYVSSVTHDIQRGQYKQSFTLARNALVSTIPKVPV